MRSSLRFFLNRIKSVGWCIRHDPHYPSPENNRFSRHTVTYRYTSEIKGREMSSNDQELTEWAQFALVAAVAASHMSMPNHWLPYSLVARAHGWTLRRTLALSKLLETRVFVRYIRLKQNRCHSSRDWQRMKL